MIRRQRFPLFIVDRLARTRPYIPHIHRVLEEDEEISFRPGSIVTQPTEEEEAAFIAQSEEVVPIQGVPLVAAPAPIASTPILPISSRRLSKTPPYVKKSRKSSKPRRKSLKASLVRDLRREEKQIKKRLREIKADLRSLGLKRKK